jgi:hypothetical protein
VANDGFQGSMVADAAGRVDFTMPAMATFDVALEAPLDPGSAPAVAKASLTYVWFQPPTPEMQNRMQQGIIRRIEAASPEGKQQILERDIPAMMAARNTLESSWPPVVMANAEMPVAR